MDDQKYPVALWPARTSSKIHVRENSQGKKDKIVGETAHIPTLESAYSRTIRLNLALHSLYAMREGFSSAAYAVEDAFMHTNHANLDGQARREELCTAILDLRRITAKVHNERPASIEQAVHIALRATSILGDTEDSRHAQRELSLAHEILSMVFQQNVSTAFKEILEFVKKHDRTSAIARLKKLMESQDKDYSPGKGNTGENKQSSWMSSPLGSKETQISDSNDDSNIAGFEQEEIECSIEDTEKAWSTNFQFDKVFDSFGKKKPPIDEGPPPKMTIRKLNMDNMKQAKVGKDVKLLTTGIRPRASRLAAAAVSPVMTRIFERDIKHSNGGTILIDASGSMQLTNEALAEFMEFIPFGTIAYYSGTDNACNPEGDLVVFAEKGRIFSEPKTPYHWGGNSIDLPAIMWLLKQEAPRWLVTDGGFCGVNQHYCLMAADLMEQAKRSGKLKVYGSIAAAKKAVKKEAEN